MTKCYNNENIVTDNDKVRQRFIDNNLSYEDIGSKEFFKLVGILNDELANFDGRFKMSISSRRKRDLPQINFDKKGCLKSAFIKVSAYYFEAREAISFNEDGFIGIAGWASGYNTKPFVNALNKWMDEIIKSKEAQ